MADSSDDSFLDRPAARLLAAGVFCGVIAVLTIQHWDDLFPPPLEEMTVDSDDPAALCIARERDQIEGMVADNPQMAAQKDLFLQRAEARCQATAGGGSAAPPPLPTN
ncbi:hypothetical protein [Algihabitans albus]|uniref:hypothetical protein n=1 Tax=Algihabitans albus TaxID=2164067 RepID=UPI000E5D3E0B|nr:hypothetical protein [Algihabitans albus]